MTNRFYSCIRVMALLLVFVLAAIQPLFALQLAGVFSDHMVLQRNHAIPVWGKAQPGSQVIVNLDGVEQKVAASADGAWRADFASRVASTKPIVIKVTGDNQTIVINDVLVGDVWFCSGQSNMGVNVNGAKNATQELKNAEHPNLRLFTFPSGASWTTGDRPAWWQKDQAYPKWAVCTRATAAGFTAVGYVFGLELLEKLDIPIGIINSAFGGAFIEPFIPRDVIKNSGKFPKLQELLKRVEKITDEEARQLEIKNQEWHDERKLAAATTKGVDAGWYKPGFDDSQWKTIPMPGYWQETSNIKLDGTLWFRHTISLDATQALADRFCLGSFRAAARVWVNGTELVVAPEAAGLSSVSYTVPAGLLKAGNNTIALRIYNMYGPGGVKKNNKEDFSLQQLAKPREVIVDLTGNWRYDVEVGIVQVGMPLRNGRTDFAVPGVIYNAMIAPFTPFPVSGIIWYQGESNVSRADEYEELLPMMINAWRDAWKDANLPFLIVQLPNYLSRKSEPSESTWANLRAAQDKTLRIPHTAMAVTYDAGDEFDIHPRDKRRVAERLALLAENMVYGIGKSSESLSPRVISATYAGNKVKLHFTPSISLKTNDGQSPRGIAVAGADGKFVWATKANIKGNTLVVDVSGVKNPARIRYAWADNPDANIISKAGLLVAPFEIAVNK